MTQDEIRAWMGPMTDDYVEARTRAGEDRASAEAAAEVARAAGLAVHLLSDEMEGESREVGKVHAALARATAAGAQAV